MLCYVTRYLRLEALLRLSGFIERSSEVAIPEGLRFTDTTLGTSMALEKNRMIAHALGAAWPGTELWSTQMRYIALTVGGCNTMVRIPRSPDKRSFVWDHAGGHLIFEEAGGKMLDLNGKEIYFGAARRLEENYGMIAAPLGMHANWHRGKPLRKGLPSLSDHTCEIATYFIPG